MDLPPVIFNPISSAVPPEFIVKTRRPPIALSTTAPGTSASMVRARLMQTADPVHVSSLKLYVPAASMILLTVLLATAAVNALTVLADTWFRCRPCSTRGATSEGGAVNVSVEMLAATMDSVPPVGEFGAAGDWEPRVAPRVGAGANWYAAQLPNPTTMRNITRGQNCCLDDTRFRRREDDRPERA